MTSFNQANIINIWFRLAHGRNILIFDTDMSLAQFNLLRRILLSEIAIIAIDMVHMTSNDSAMIDEVLANRLGTIPVIISDQDTIVRKDLCDCHSFCNKCSFVLEYGGKDFLEKSWLMSDHISPYLMKDIPIVTVLPEQKVSFKLICSKSIAKEHSKWSPGVVCSLTKLQDTRFLRVTLYNTGPVEFSYILKQAFSLMKSRLNIDIKID